MPGLDPGIHDETSARKALRKFSSLLRRFMDCRDKPDNDKSGGNETVIGVSRKLFRRRHRTTR